MVRRYGMPSPGNLRTPLEGVDLVADGLNRVASAIPDALGSIASAAGRAADNLEADIERPRGQPERPIPPDVLIEPIPSAIGHVVTGVIDVVKSGVDSVVQNVEGARRELEDFIRG